MLASMATVSPTPWYLAAARLVQKHSPWQDGFGRDWRKMIGVVAVKSRERCWRGIDSSGLDVLKGRVEVLAERRLQ